MTSVLYEMVLMLAGVEAGNAQKKLQQQRAQSYRTTSQLPKPLNPTLGLQLPK